MRNYDDPTYKKFRRAVLKRDKHTCQMCKAKKRLQVHHISKWSSSPTLRYDTGNGITLCRNCHTYITGKEVHFEKFLLMIVAQNEKRK